MKNKIIAVWFSSGAASAVAAKMVVDLYGAHNTVRVLNNPIKEEDADNLRFLQDVEKWIGVKIEFVKNPKYPNCSAVEIWNLRRYMSDRYGAPCTVELKKRARQYWEKNNKTDFNVLGYTVDETQRHERFIRAELIPVLPVLISGGVTKKDCYAIIERAGLILPRIYAQGYPNANCIGCVKASSPTYWNHVRKLHPLIFEERAKQSRALGVKLVKVRGERLFLDQLDPAAKGRRLKNMDFECGLFCAR